MLKPLALAFATLTLSLSLSACGTQVGVSAVAAGGAMAPARLHSSAAKAVKLPAKLTVLKVTRKTGPSPKPGHLLPVSEDFTIAGRSEAGAFVIEVAGRNPGGQMYMPIAESVTFNGQKLPRQQFGAIVELLTHADFSRADEHAKWQTLHARSVVVVSMPLEPARP